MQNTKSIKRIDYLDSTRGLAALSVAIYHIIESHWGWMKEAKLSYLIFNGSDAVAMFFVLSGLVLSLKYIRKDIEITPKEYRKFIVARLFRLYPAFLFVLIVQYVYMYWDVPTWEFIKGTLVNKYRFLNEAVLVRNQHTIFLPDWTLGVEMAMSILVPFMLIIMRKSQQLFIYMLIGFVFMGKGYISEFALHFGLGMLICLHFDKIVNMTKTNFFIRYKWLLIPVAFLLYSIRHILKLAPLPAELYAFINGFIGLGEFTLTGIGSALILIYIINSERAQRFLSTRPLIFLGKISYGVYLTHWFFNAVFMDNFDYVLVDLCNNNKTMLLALYMTFSLTCSFITSTFIYYYVELPFITLGRKALKKLKLQ